MGKGKYRLPLIAQFPLLFNRIAVPFQTAG
jgi:hypothetical protein